MSVKWKTGAPEDSVLESSPLSTYLSVLRDLPDGDTVAYAMVRGVLGMAGASMAIIYSARTDGVTADLVGAHGVTPKQLQVYRVVSAEMHLPGPEAFRTGVERVLPAEQVAKDYPLAAPFFESLPARGDQAFIPLVHRGAPIGFLVVGFAAALERSWEVRATIDAVADATALWVLADAQRNGEARALSGEPPRLAFTVRQRNILFLLREGMATKEIATRLGYSAATIKADITSLSKLLGASGRADLLVKAKRAGL